MNKLVFVSLVMLALIVSLSSSGLRLLREAVCARIQRLVEESIRILQRFALLREQILYNEAESTVCKGIAVVADDYNIALLRKQTW